MRKSQLSQQFASFTSGSAAPGANATANTTGSVSALDDNFNPIFGQKKSPDSREVSSDEVVTAPASKDSKAPAAPAAAPASTFSPLAAVPSNAVDPAPISDKMFPNRRGSNFGDSAIGVLKNTSSALADENIAKRPGDGDDDDRKTRTGAHTGTGAGGNGDMEEGRDTTVTESTSPSQSSSPSKSSTTFFGRRSSKVADGAAAGAGAGGRKAPKARGEEIDAGSSPFAASTASPMGHRDDNDL